MREITRDEALEVLELGADASPAEIRRAFETQYNDFRIRLDNAPSPALRSRFQEGLARLECAYAALAGEEARDSYGDLPASAPVEGPASGARQSAPASSGPPSGTGAASGVLVVRSDEPCEVFLDDRLAGRLESPSARLRLEALPGAHELRAATDDGRAWEVEVTLEAARQQIVRVELPARVAMPQAVATADDAPVSMRADAPDATAARVVRWHAPAAAAAAVALLAAFVLWPRAGSDASLAASDATTFADTSDSVLVAPTGAASDTSPSVPLTASVRQPIVEPARREEPEPANVTVPVTPRTAAERFAAEYAKREEYITIGLELTREAAEAGLAPAQAGLGYKYADGRGVAVDLGEAMRWYRLAADQGFAPAEDHIGDMYAYGTGVTRDHAEAMRWYRRAADRGLASAHIHIAYMHEKGMGVPVDTAEAVLRYRLAGRSLARESDFERAHTKAFLRDKLTVFAERGNPEAQYQLARSYDDGSLGRRSSEQAIRWYRRASSSGVAEAAEALTRLGIH